MLRLLATVAIVSNAIPLRHALVLLKRTTLRAAWWWGASALCLWGSTWLATEALGVVREGIADQLWYASAVLMVTPFAAALGARRPGTRVWSWFVVLPLTIVLFLPATTAWNRDLRPAPLCLELPMLAGYFLVLVMGVVNYFGTRFGVAAFLAGAAGLGVTLPLSSLGSRLAVDGPTAHAAATIVLSLAAWHASSQGRRSSQRRIPLERVWIDFRDLFGIVWARRILDRANQAAVRENWSVRLHLNGFSQVESQEPFDLSPPESDRIEQTLRWLLRRFVDPQWIDERLAALPGQSKPSETSQTNA